MARRPDEKEARKSKPATTHGCLGKIGYATLSEAEGAKRRIIQRLKDADKLRAYHCKRCGKHHLGRWRRDGRSLLRKTADHHAGSYKERRRKYLELTQGK